MARKPFVHSGSVVPPVEAPQEPPAPPVDLTVTNCLDGTTLSLGDGRELAFGESAEVSEALATFLRERGQVS